MPQSLVALHDFAVCEQPPEVLRDERLPRMRPEHHQTFVERAFGAFQRFEAHRTGQVGDAREAQSFEHAERPRRGHVLRAVDQREPFFGLELDRPKAGA